MKKRNRKKGVKYAPRIAGAITCYCPGTERIDTYRGNVNYSTWLTMEKMRWDRSGIKTYIDRNNSGNLALVRDASCPSK